MVYPGQTQVCYYRNHIQLINLIVKMKKFYPATLSLCAVIGLLAISFSASAQTYAGGTYTTTPVLVGSGPYNWNPNGGVSIWLGTNGTPPAVCDNCLIQLVGPGIIHLNTSVLMKNNSSLVVGPGVTLEIDNSNGSDVTTANSIIMSDATNSTLVLQDVSSKVDATPAGTYDGVFVRYDETTPFGYQKEFGNAPSFFVGTAIPDKNGAEHGTTDLGPSTLNSMGNILPIILSNFSAVLNDGAVDLSWTTASEANSDHFAVQRSTNAGSSWSVIGTVAAAGNSSGTLNYTYTDNKPAQGTSEYRLQLVDKDGKYTYSEVKSIRTGIVTSVSVYPNPARDFVNVTLGGNAGESMLIRLFNQSGQVLVEKNISNAGGTTVPLAVSSYPEGNYLIVVSAADGSRQISKLVITK
jgi:hypothetical protein